MKSYPGNEGFLFGPLLAKDAEFKKKVAEGEVLPNSFVWILNELCAESREAGDPDFDATKNRVVSINVLGKVFIWITDPEAVGDFYNKHNADLTKHEMVAELFEPMFENIFGTMPTNEEWKVQRKAIAHMFFK